MNNLNLVMHFDGDGFKEHLDSIKKNLASAPPQYIGSLTKEDVKEMLEVEKFITVEGWSN